MTLRNLLGPVAGCRCQNAQRPDRGVSANQSNPIIANHRYRTAIVLHRGSIADLHSVPSFPSRKYSAITAADT